MENKQLEQTIKDQYRLYKNTNSESIKRHVIFPLLKEYGYDLQNMITSENSIANEFVVAGINANKLVVHVVNPNEQLDYQKQEYLISRISVAAADAVWGLLSNGQDYILMNRMIILGSKFDAKNITDNRPEVVFKLNIFNSKDLVYIDYLNNKNLFELGVTEYYKKIAEFKALKYPVDNRNWYVYRSTILGFFDYFIAKYKKYIELSRITVDDFEAFLRNEMSMKKNKDIISITTIASKYSYIRSFFKTLNVKNSEFYAKKGDFVERFNADMQEAKEYDNELLNPDNIREILSLYDNSRDAIRNKTLFLLCLAYGMERSTLINLTFNQVKERYLLIDGKKIPIPSKLWNYLQELKVFNEEKYETDYLFSTKYGGKTSKISEAQVNYVFDCLGDNNSAWKKLNPAYIRYVLIKMLFKNNYSIEEIVYLTGADLTTITKYISIEDIIAQVESRTNGYKKVHPYSDFLGDF